MELDSDWMRMILAAKMHRRAQKETDSLRGLCVFGAGRMLEGSLMDVGNMADPWGGTPQERPAARRRSYG